MNRSPDPTIPDRSGAYDATLASPSPDSTTQPVSVGTTGRTTVLPRIEWSGDAARFVSSARPRFEAQGGLGEGGVGEVVAALDQDIGREVAIKRLRPDVLSPSAMVRFLDEIRVVGSLEHPNIVPIHDVGVDEKGAMYFVMRRVQGQTLESIIEKLAAGDPLAKAHWTFERRLHVFRQLLEAVAFAHGRGIVHRDIKPSNVMVGHFGEVFLMDWGIAKPLEGGHELPRLDAAPRPLRVTETHTGAVVGTPAYMSPEQARGEKVDVRSDTYSLSVLLFELMGLEHYLQDHLSDSTTLDQVIHAVQHAPAPLLAFKSHPHQLPVPAELGWYVAKGLKKDPAERFQTVTEMIERLDRRDEGVFPVQCPVTFSKRGTRVISRFVDRHPYLVSTMLMLSVLGGIGYGIWRLLA